MLHFDFRNIDIHNIIIKTAANKTTLVTIYMQDKKAYSGN